MIAFLPTAACLLALLLGGGTLQEPESVSLTIHGSSNVHDWTSEATDVRVRGDFRTDASGRLTAVEGLVITVPVEGIKSEKGRIMDGKTYKALLSDEYPDIRFEATAVRVSGSAVTAEGQLRIAGQSRPVTLTAKWAEDGTGLSLSGSYDLLMTDFGIDPPTAMMGAMKTTNEVTVRYRVQLASMP